MDTAENIKLNKENQSQKNTHYDEIPDTPNVHNRKMYVDTPRRFSSCLGLGGIRDENILELDCADDCTLVNVLKTTVHFK